MPGARPAGIRKAPDSWPTGIQPSRQSDRPKTETPHPTICNSTATRWRSNRHQGNPLVKRVLSTHPACDLGAHPGEARTERFWTRPTLGRR